VPTLQKANLNDAADLLLSLNSQSILDILLKKEASLLANIISNLRKNQVNNIFVFIHFMTKLLTIRTQLKTN